MSLTINNDGMSGNHTQHTAHLIPGQVHEWEVSWLPGRRLTYTDAVTAMVIADMAGETDLRPGDRLWPHVAVWADSIGLSAPDALAQVAEPPGGIDPEEERAAQFDREAAD
jgi:hypothetical protein